MLFSLLADLTLIIHLLFILFVIFGALLVLKWRWIMWLHVPCAIWGALIEFYHWICPLTHVEVYFRQMANETGYTGGFIAYYLVPVIYPPGLTPAIQIALGVMVLLINLILYSLVAWKTRGGTYERKI